MGDLIGAFLMMLVTSVLSWVVLFALVFGAIMLTIVGIGKVRERIKSSEEPSSIDPFVATPEYIQMMSDLMLLLSDKDERLVEILPLFKKDKLSFAQQYLPDSSDAIEDEDSYYWRLMILTLEEFGYLSYTDWKDPMIETFTKLSPVLDHYNIDSHLWDDIPNMYDIGQEESCYLLAERLPADYALISIDTQEDSYAITVAPVEVAKEAERIALPMDNFSDISMVRIISATETA